MTVNWLYRRTPQRRPDQQRSRPSPLCSGSSDLRDDGWRDGRRCCFHDVEARLCRRSLIFLGFLLHHAHRSGWVERYHPFFYWAVVVATTTVGTTMSDYLDRTLGLGYVMSSTILLCGVIAVLFAWRRSTGAIQFENITTRKNEVFLLGDDSGVKHARHGARRFLSATDTGLGFERGALVFAGLPRARGPRRTSSRRSPAACFSGPRMS